MGSVNLCTESSPGFIMSPRISFSHNLYQNDFLQIESSSSTSNHHQQQQHIRSDDSLLLEPSQFDFCMGSSGNFIQESSSSADELFSDGKLLPLLLKQKLLPSPQQNSQFHYDPPPIATAITTSTVTAPETDSADSTDSSIEPTDSTAEPEEIITEKSSLSPSSSASSASAPSNSKSFWGFKRSSSCGNGGYKKSLICSLSILPRSNSTGSAPNIKSKENQKQKLQKSKSAYSSSSSTNSSSSSCQKPPLKKNYGGGYNSINGGRMNPAHNVPPPYIPGNLFGLGSLFSSSSSSNGKDKNRKK
ncbi:hypothetical protein MKW94_022603 [Papaver nudicaule]|uniref:Uncharacterized protein n=1 Tax=Papaver nudicaule TaxID=74823 RepID=A0AA41RWL6_PAPNU|nr:hypothetical protein [Papaver nudicaule]